MATGFAGRGTAFAAIVAGGMIAAGSAAAEYRVLGQSELREAIVGKTVVLETMVGTIPISFAADGTMTGRSANMLSYLGRGFDRGTWWIAGNQLCQKWKMWLDGKSYCFTIRRSGSDVQWTRNDGMTGTLTVASN